MPFGPESKHSIPGRRPAPFFPSGKKRRPGKGLGKTGWEWISFAFRGASEPRGDKTTPVPNTSGRWIDHSPFESDEFGIPRAYVRFSTTAEEQQLATVMADARIALARGPPNGDGAARAPGTGKGR